MKKLLFLFLVILLSAFENGHKVCRILFIGDSLTSGYNALHEDAAPSHIIPATYLYDKENLGVGGIKMIWLDSIVGKRILNNKNLLGETLLVIQIGINDLGTGSEPKNVYQCLKDFCLKYRILGFKILVATLPSSSPLYGGNERIEYNELIRNNYNEFADGIIDLGADKNIGLPDSYKNNIYFCDIVHLTYKGYVIIASLMKNAIDNLILNNRL